MIISHLLVNRWYSSTWNKRLTTSSGRHLHKQTLDVRCENVLNEAHCHQLRLCLQLVKYTLHLHPIRVKAEEAVSYSQKVMCLFTSQTKLIAAVSASVLSPHTSIISELSSCTLATVLVLKILWCCSWCWITASPWTCWSANRQDKLNMRLSDNKKKKSESWNPDS